MNLIRRPFHLIRDAYKRDIWNPIIDAVVVLFFASLWVWRNGPSIATAVWVVLLVVWALAWTAWFEARRQAKEKVKMLEECVAMLDHMRMSDREAYLSAAHQLAEEVDLNADLMRINRELRDKIAATKETTA